MYTQMSLKLIITGFISTNLCLFGINDALSINTRPIIAVLSQEEWIDGQANNSYIAASYVKNLESAGARVVPILLNQDDLYYKLIIDNTNGLFFPGGGQDPIKSYYAKAAFKLWKYAMEENNRNDTVGYPIWGTCLGFQLISVIALDGQDKLSRCQSYDVPLKLDFVVGNDADTIRNHSKMFSEADDHTLKILTTENVTANYHHWCLTPEDFNQSGLNKSFRIISTNHDDDGKQFISAYESIHHPIYATQFHPEKNIFEFVVNKNVWHIPHSINAIKIGQYFANFFVSQTRINSHKFPNKKSESDSLIYNYQTFYTGKSNESDYEQVYRFKIKGNHVLKQQTSLIYP